MIRLSSLIINYQDGSILNVKVGQFYLTINRGEDDQCDHDRRVQVSIITTREQKRHDDVTLV